MQQLTERIGFARFLQVAIEGWNEILLVILILTMVTGIRQDRSRKNKQSVSIPLTKELTVYFTAVLLYNLCDIIDIIAGGDPSKLSYHAIRAGVFLYYAVGGFQTVFFLQVIKEHISKKLGKKRISAVMTCFQAAHIPLFILLLSTPFIGALYSITDENIYVRSWGYMVWQTVTILSFICIAAVIITQWRSIGYFLKNIIAEKGIDGFIETENRILSGLDAVNSVVSTGGSVIYGDDAMRNLSQNGVVIYLKLDYNKLKYRLHNIRNRGVVIREGQSLSSLYRERAPLYEKYADIIIDENGCNIEKTVNKIMDSLNGDL